MDFIVGNLYVYSCQRNIYDSCEGLKKIGSLEINEPFVILEHSKEELKWCEGYKVLTTKGIVGWIHIGYPEQVIEVKE